MKRQLAFLLARAQIPIEWLQPPSDDDDDIPDELPEDLIECLSNTRLSLHFREFGKELGVAEAKSLEDVYKSHLENTSAIPSSHSWVFFLFATNFFRTWRDECG
jgi:26S proteasome regulatory subunit N1